MHTVIANGAEIPAIGLGTWTLSGSSCTELVAHAISAGYRHIDTAAMYENEREVGEAIRHSGIARDELFVTTKVWWTDIASGDLERSAQASLERLGLDQVDLLLIHWPNPQIPLKESITALNAVRDGGLTRHIGVSNFPTVLLSEAVHFSDAPLVANQVEYHPYLGQGAVYQACRSAGMSMVSYCPLCRGGALFEETAVRAAAERHSKSAAQIVLRWHVQQDGVVAIPRTQRKERQVENLDVFDFVLSNREMEQISALSLRNQRVCDFDFSPDWDSQ